MAKTVDKTVKVLKSKKNIEPDPKSFLNHPFVKYYPLEVKDLVKFCGVFLRLITLRAQGHSSVLTVLSDISKDRVENVSINCDAEILKKC